MMDRDFLGRVEFLHRRLIRLAQAWASGKAFDAGEAADLRQRALLLNHTHYLRSVPAYRKLAEEVGIRAIADLGPIKAGLLSTDDLFKSYDPAWLDENRFDLLNRWLGMLFHQRVEFDVSGITTLDAWMDRLIRNGVRPVYSSGSSGRFSFVPRDAVTWHRFATAPACYIAPLFLRLGFGDMWQRMLTRLAMSLLDPFTFASLARKRRLPGFDAVFLGFRGGHMGTQVVMQEFAKSFATSTFLYEFHLSASTLRLLSRGPKTPEQDRAVLKFREATIAHKERNYARIITALKESTLAGQKVVLAGPPYLFKELLEMVSVSEGHIALPAGSFAITGGGWKTFTGIRIEHQVLSEMISNTFGLPPRHIFDDYSMAEMNGAMARCEHGRYHVPPILECMVVDEALQPISGRDVSGTLAFMDPFAISYPGFIISGDRVRMVDQVCACGIHGPALTEIGRAPGREARGCAGVMASIEA